MFLLTKGARDQGRVRVRVLQVRLDEAALVVHEALVALVEEPLADHLGPEDLDPPPALLGAAVDVEQALALHPEDGLPR